MIGALSVEKKKRLNSINPRKPSIPVTNNHRNSCDKEILAAARMGVEGAKFGPLCHQITPPMLESTKRVSSSGGQLFLCILGTLLSVSVGVWLALFNNDSVRWRKLLLSGSAFACALMFTLLAYATIKRRRHMKEPEIEINPSILIEHRKSMSNSLRKNTNPTSDELLRQIRRHSTSITVESCERLLKAKNGQAVVINTNGTGTTTTTTNGNFLSVDQQKQLKRASTSN